MPNCKFSSDATFKKKTRGFFEEYVSTFQDTPFTSVLWLDNKAVALLSTYVGSIPVQQVKRFDKKEKKRVEIQCPNLVLEYNKHMGGVDLLDSILGRFKISMRSRKWYCRIFYHLVDVAIINAWLLYRRVEKHKGNTTTITMEKFRGEIANCLCNVGQNLKRKGRPSSSVDRNLELKKKKQLRLQFLQKM